MNYLLNLNASRLFTRFFLILPPILTVLASVFYTGSKVLFIIYGLLASVMVFSLYKKRNGYFSLFFLSFLILGCWLKVILHFLFYINFIEPTGQFNYSPSKWNAALLILIAAFATLLACFWLSTLFTKKIRLPSQSFKSSSYLLPLLILSFASAAALLFFNYYFSILKIGTEPLIKLPSPLYMIIAFMVAWGNAILISALAFWLIKDGKLKPCWMFYLLSLLGALTSISMCSRVQIILYTAVPFILYFYKVSPFDRRFTKNEWIKMVFIATALFLATLLFVFTERYHNFLHAQLKEPGAKPAQTIPNKIRPSYIKIKYVGRVKQTFWTHSLYQFNKLIVNRWIGLEGVLAVSSATNQLGMNLFRTALFENPARGNDAIYQKMSNSSYQKYKNFVFMTIPGPIAFFYYSGSLLMVALGLALLYFTGYFLEHLANIFLKNEGVNAAIGVALAYLFVQLNFPVTLAYFIIELVVFLGGLALLKFLLHRQLHPQRLTQPIGNFQS